MKHPMKRIFLLVALLFGAFLQMSAQNTYVHLIITMNDGTEETYDMYSVSYMYFESGDKLVITETVDGLSYVRYPLSDIRKIEILKIHLFEQARYPHFQIFPLGSE